MSTYTKNYNLDKYEGTDAPNLLDQYNSAMDKIDTQLATNTNNTASVGALVQGYETRIKDLEAETEELNTSKAPTNHASDTTEYGAASETQYGHAKLYSTMEGQSDGAVTPAAVQGAIDSAISGISTIPPNNSITTEMLKDGCVTGAKIAAGAISANNLNASAIQNILQAFPVYRFDDSDPTADNDGLALPTGVNMSGYYIDYLELLIICTLHSKGSVKLNAASSSGYNQISLPSYVPRVTQNTYMGTWIIGQASSGTFQKFTGLTYVPGGYLGVNSDIAAGLEAGLVGNIVHCFRARNAGLSTLEDGAYTAAVKNNGMMI